MVLTIYHLIFKDWAARRGSADVVSYLYTEGVDPDYQNKCKETALHVAVRYGHLGMYK